MSYCIYLCHVAVERIGLTCFFLFSLANAITGCRSQPTTTATTVTITSRVEEPLPLTSSPTWAMSSLFSRATATDASWSSSSTMPATIATADDQDKTTRIQTGGSCCACCASSSVSSLSSHTSNCRLSGGMPPSTTSSSTGSNSSRSSARRTGNSWRTTALAVLVVFLAFSLRVTGTCKFAFNSTVYVCVFALIANGVESLLAVTVTSASVNVLACCPAFNAIIDVLNTRTPRSISIYLAVRALSTR